MVLMDRAWQDWIMSTQRRERCLAPAVDIGMKIRRTVARLGSRLFSRSASESSLRATSAVRYEEALQQMPKTERPFRRSRNRRPQTLCHRIAATNRPLKVSSGPPPRACRTVDRSVQPSLYWSSPHPFPARGSRIHPALPWAPVAQCRRTERQDGKRNLHFQHAT